MNLTAAVITVSDKGYRGERVDTSGPALCRLLAEDGWNVIHTAVVPDEKDTIEAELLHCADGLELALVLTTGGTGFSPRDITPEATKAVTEREAPGFPELMRAESMKITPHGCLSRGTAGIRGRTLILNLPGSEKAVAENYQAVRRSLLHGVKMLQSEGSAECASQSGKAPSMDLWLREAKAASNAADCGMYLFHNGVVRRTSKAQVRHSAQTDPVVAMEFSCDREKAAAAEAAAKEMPGIYYVRVWLNSGTLRVGDDLMQVLIGGDTRPHVVQALQFLVDKLKNECVTEREIY